MTPHRSEAWESHSEAGGAGADSSCEAPHRRNWEGEGDEGGDGGEQLWWSRNSCKLAAWVSLLDGNLAMLEV